MREYQSWNFPELPPAVIELLENEKKIAIVGVIGKSAFPDCNKMVALNLLQREPSLIDHSPEEGQIQFYYCSTDSMLLVHFETTYDNGCMEKMLAKELEVHENGQFFLFNQRVRNRFARMLLFATQVCHIIVFVELSVYFDASMLSMFKSLKIIRERHVLKFLPKIIKNTNSGSYLGKAARLCSPRILFLFENFPDGYEKSKELITKLEFDVEDNIYKMLRNEFIITNNSSMSLFSVAGNKRFVYYNTDSKLRQDPLIKSIKELMVLLEAPKSKDSEDDDLEELLPYKGFGAPLIHWKHKSNQLTEEELYLKERNFMSLLKEHVDEALSTGFDDGLTKFKGRSHFVILPIKAWYDTFKLLHKIFIENPDNPEFEANDVDYKAYLDNFDQTMTVDNEFFKSCCEIGFQKAFLAYDNPTLSHYSAEVHKKMTDDAVATYYKFARGPGAHINEAKLRKMCDDCWQDGKQQCTVLSLRGNCCAMPRHVPKDASDHSSGLIFVAACNCGRTQGRREDPYTIRSANYEFYEYMANNCNLCVKVRKINVPVFQPSINDYRAAEFEIAFPKLMHYDHHSSKKAVTPISSAPSDEEPETTQPLTASQGSHTNLSLESVDINKIDDNDDEEEEDINSSDESLKELVIQVKDKEAREEEEKERVINRQPSTTEYLPSMVHTESPVGLLPQFPSWSLACVGPSSIYSHNTGLMEHFQTGFLSGANFLLPWDVHVRLEHSASWAAAYEKTRYRKMGEVFVLKIFVGFEYECCRGHRFMMSSPDKALRGVADITRDSGSKVVYNNMPLYFNCACRSQSSDVAQLMRIHVVTPKAPVNVMLDPKVRTGDRDYTFTMGLPTPAKLTQSAYWILRLPYIYQGDEGPIAPPQSVNAANAMNFGCLLANMFGVTETVEE